jgi:hypothetical protein
MEHFAAEFFDLAGAPVIFAALAVYAKTASILHYFGLQLTPYTA